MSVWFWNYDLRDEGRDWKIGYSIAYMVDLLSELHAHLFLVMKLRRTFFYVAFNSFFLFFNLYGLSVAVFGEIFFIWSHIPTGLSSFFCPQFIDYIKATFGPKAWSIIMPFSVLAFELLIEFISLTKKLYRWMCVYIKSYHTIS